MNAYRDVILQGRLTTAEPFTYTDPNWDSDDKRKKSNAPPPALPVLAGLPYITGSSFRGALRRAATRALFAANHGKRFDPQALVITTVGGMLNSRPKGKGSEKDDNEADEAAEAAAEQTAQNDPDDLHTPKDIAIPAHDLLVARAANPVISVFGTMGPRCIPGVLAVSHCPLDGTLESIGWTDVTSAGQTRIFGNRTDLQERDPDLATEVSTDDFDAYFERQRAKAGRHSDAKARLHDANAELGKARRRGASEEDIAALKDKLNLARETLDKENTSQFKTPVNYPYVKAGAPFASTLRLMHATDEDLALFARALDYFAAYARLGGHQAQGMGLMDGEWTIRERPSNDPLAPPVRTGSVRFAGNDFARAQWQFTDPKFDFRQFDFDAVQIDYIPAAFRGKDKTAKYAAKQEG
ncbi:MAG TPA: RAMP superfamily CRISPR-associated protein [Rhodanobacteraceae bacterium]